MVYFKKYLICRVYTYICKYNNNHKRRNIDKKTLELNGKKPRMNDIFIFDICFDIRTMRVYIHKIEHFSYSYKLVFCLSVTFIKFIRCLLIISSYIHTRSMRLWVVYATSKSRSDGWDRTTTATYLCKFSWIESTFSYNTYFRKIS